MAEFPLGVTAVMLPELSFDEQIALCQACGVTHYCFRPRIIAEQARDKPYHNHGRHAFDLTPELFHARAEALTQQLTDAGLTPFGTVPTTSITDDDAVLTHHFEAAAKAQAGRVRVGAGYPSRQIFDYAARLHEIVAGYQRAVALARPLGIKIVIETHSNSPAASPALAWNIVRHFDPADLGVIFDLPNFGREGALMPHLAVSILKDWIDHVHIGGHRRTTGDRDEFGFRNASSEMCPMTEGDLHLPTWIRALAEAGLSVPLIIEDFTANVPGAERLRAGAAALQRVLGTDQS